MPGFDGTGPRGFGLGRGLGPCGSGQRRGRNRFWNYFNFFKNRPYNQPSASKENQKSFLEEKLNELKED